MRETRAKHHREAQARPLMPWASSWSRGRPEDEAIPQRGPPEQRQSGTAVHGMAGDRNGKAAWIVTRKTRVPRSAAAEGSQPDQVNNPWRLPQQVQFLPFPLSIGVEGGKPRGNIAAKPVYSG